MCGYDGNIMTSGYEGRITGVVGHDTTTSRENKKANVTISGNTTILGCTCRITVINRL